MAAAGDICNRPTILGGQLKGIYERVGFVDVEERVFKMPINGWPKDDRLKEIGRMWEANFVQGLSGFSLSMFTRAYDMTPAEIEVCCATRLQRLAGSDHAAQGVQSADRCLLGFTGKCTQRILRSADTCIFAGLGSLGPEATSRRECRVTPLESRRGLIQYWINLLIGFRYIVRLLFLGRWKCVRRRLIGLYLAHYRC